MADTSPKMLADPEPTRRRRWLYLVGFVIVVYAAFNLAMTVVRAPSRSGIIDLGGQQVQVTISMVPDPPKTGPIPVQVAITDSTGSPAAADLVVVRYGTAGQGPAETVAAPGASGGVYRAQIEFQNVGGGWVEIAIRRGTAVRQFRFSVDVRPNI